MTVNYKQVNCPSNSQYFVPKTWNNLPENARSTSVSEILKCLFVFFCFGVFYGKPEAPFIIIMISSL